MVRRIGESLLVGAALLAVAACLVAPTTQAQFMGTVYGLLASDPLGRVVQAGEVERLRLLSPLLGHALGLTGARWPLLPLLMIWLLLATLHAHLRDQGLRAWDAVGVGALVGFAVPVSWTLVFPGYVDATSLLLLLLCLVSLQRPAGSWSARAWAPLLTLGILNHESVAFVAPGLFGVALWVAPPGRRLRAGLAWLALAALALGLALLARGALARHVGAPVTSIAMVNLGAGLRDGLPTLLIGVFMGFKLSWGLPVVLAALERRQGRLRLTPVVAAMIVLVLAQLLVATDTTRLMAPAFLAIVLSAVALHRLLTAQHFRVLVWSLVLANAAIPQVFSVPQGLVLTQPLPIALLLSAQGRHPFHTVSIYATPRATHSTGQSGPGPGDRPRR